MQVALTIDAEHPDRPTDRARQNALDLLNLLREKGVSATFFVQGMWAYAYPDLAATIARDGHLIASHSYWHCVFTSLSDDG
ncbi:MAG TPA: polysaccharide deacetylase family protein, partial [Acidimicrobiales bacterium]|nr:polysaccharide deacetylase family protein [Acidimicrobiales bacterium]